MKVASVFIDLNQPQHTLAEYDSQYHDIRNYRMCVVPDLHGSFIKLISVLIHLHFITYRADPHKVNSWLLTVREELITYIGLRLPNTDQNEFEQIIVNALNRNFCLVCTPERLLKTEIVFLGDVLCDRGESDLITLSIFDWMTKLGIRYRIVCGNHDFQICSGAPFSNQPNSLFARPSQGQENIYFCSFDYFKVNKSLQNYFKYLLERYLSNLRAFIIHFISLQTQPQNSGCVDLESPLVLLTHAPCQIGVFFNFITKLNLDPSQIDIKHLFDSTLSASAQNYLNNHFIRNVFLQGMRTPKMLWSQSLSERVEAFQNFCFNRDYRTTCFINQTEGINIFGHMGGVCFPETELPGLHETQICLDQVTGMPNQPTGLVRYAFL